MSEPITCEVLPEHLVRQRAVQAWSRLRAERVEPEGVEILKLKLKSAVCRLAGVGPGGSAVIAKRCLRSTALIERMIHEEYLPSLPVPAPRLYGFLEDPDNSEFCWLFLEDAKGEEYSPHNAEHRELAGRWLGTVHAASMDAALARRLPDRGPDHYLELLRSSRAVALEHLANPALPAGDLATLRAIASQCDLVECHWGEVEAFCETIPPTLVHGDLVVKNVYVRSAPTGLALLVFDWENAGWGVPATDLCQFTGRTVSPDLKTYTATVQQSGRLLDPCKAQQLAEYGAILRVLDDIQWAALRMVFGSYIFLEKPVSQLRSCESLMAGALRTAEWTFVNHPTTKRSHATLSR